MEEDDRMLVQRVTDDGDGRVVERRSEVGAVDHRADGAGDGRDRRAFQGRGHTAARFSTNAPIPSAISAESPGTVNRDTSPGRSWALRSRLMVARRDRTGAADLFEDPVRARVELLVRHDLADQAHGARGVRVDLGGGEEEVPRPGEPDDVDDARRHVRVGQPAQELGDAEPRPIGRDGHVAVHREVEPTGDAATVDLRHPDLAAALDVAEREVIGAVPLRGQPLRVLRLPGEVAADTEPVAGAGEAHRVELGLAVGPHRGALDAPVHVLGERVALLDAVDAQVEDAIVDARDEVAAAELRRDETRVAHGSLYTAAALSCSTLRTISSGKPPSSSCA